MKGRSKRLAMVLLGCLMATSGSGADQWWIKSPLDVVWTNRPLSEIQEAAVRGHATGELYYARHLFITASREEEQIESLKWVMRAAEAGFADAQFMAARFHLSGTATVRDYRAGFTWASRSASQGNPDGLALLADLYATATGTTRNTVQARQLFQRAIEAGSTLALDWFGHFHLSGEAGTAAKTNYAEALQCFERAASNGMAHAVTHLIVMYRDGLGTPPSMERALDWARFGADHHDLESTELLAAFYASGLAEPRDAQETPLLLIRLATATRARAAERDDNPSASLRSYHVLNGNCRDLWNRYRFGIGTPRDYIAAAQWMLVAYRQDVLRNRNQDAVQAKPLHPFNDAVQKTNAPASLEEGLWQDALRRIHSALETSNARTAREIGLDYRRGSALTPRDPILAYVWLARAVQLNAPVAQDDLADLERSLSSEQVVQAKKLFLPRSRRLP